MSAFDIQSMAPEGYEIINVEDRRGGATLPDHDLISFDARVTMRKKWTPKVGEVVAVRDFGGDEWLFDVFRGFEPDSSTPVICKKGGWVECRRQTPEERGE